MATYNERLNMIFEKVAELRDMAKDTTDKYKYYINVRALKNNEKMYAYAYAYSDNVYIGTVNSSSDDVVHIITKDRPEGMSYDYFYDKILKALEKLNVGDAMTILKGNRKSIVYRFN